MGTAWISHLYEQKYEWRVDVHWVSGSWEQSVKEKFKIIQYVLINLFRLYLK